MLQKYDKEKPYKNTPFCLALNELGPNIGKQWLSKLARRINKTPQYIWRLKEGSRSGTEETRRAIAEALGVEYEDMLLLGKQLMQKGDDADLQQDESTAVMDSEVQTCSDEEDDLMDDELDVEEFWHCFQDYIKEIGNDKGRRAWFAFAFQDEFKNQPHWEDFIQKKQSPRESTDKDHHNRSDDKKEVA